MNLAWEAAWASAVGAVAVLAWGTKWIARAGWVDRPGGRKRHEGVVVLSGGFAIAFGLAVAAVWCARRGGQLPSLDVVVGLLSLAAVGWVDDRVPGGLSAAVKAALSGAVLAGWAWRFGVGFDAVWALPVAFALLHAFNTSDNTHGLCGGLAALGAGAAAWAAAEGRFGVDVAWPSAWLGGLLVFVSLNASRGRPFLGDGGSLLLGGACAGLWLAERSPDALVLGWWPLVDFVTVAWLRFRLGVPPWRGDRRHLSHRLARRMGRVPALGALWMAQGGVTVLVFATPAASQWWAVAALGVVSVAVAWSIQDSPSRPA